MLSFQKAWLHYQTALEKKISMTTKAITNICEELKGAQIKVKVKKKKKHVKKKKCQATKKGREDAGVYSRKSPLRRYCILNLQESFWVFKIITFSKKTQKDKVIFVPGGLSAQSAFHKTTTPQCVTSSMSESCDSERKP